MRGSGLRWAVRVAACAAAQGAAAQVVHDGTLGAAGAVGGPNFNIAASRGQIRGANLFQSFSQFDLKAGERATFSGPAGVRNVLARVTGGAPSSIDGTLASDIAGANLYFVNPAGITFGPNARLDVSGAFVASTADVVKLGKSAGFATSLPADTVLRSASPTAFGFLGTRAPGAITVSGGQLAVTGGGLAVIGGDVTLRASAKLSATDGKVQVASVGAGAGSVTGDAARTDVALATQSFTSMGRVTITQGSQLISDGTNGQGVRVVAGDLSMKASTIEVAAATTPPTKPSGVEVALTGALDLDDSSIVGHNSGDTRISAASMRLRGGGGIDQGVFQIPTVFSGNLALDVAGTLTIEAGSAVRMNPGSFVSNDGNMTINAGSIAIHGGADPFQTGIAMVNHEQLTIRAGDLTSIGGVTVGNVTTFEPGGPTTTIIASGTVSFDGTGSEMSLPLIGAGTGARAGILGRTNVTADRLVLRNGAGIFAASFDEAVSDVRVQAREMSFEGGPGVTTGVQGPVIVLTGQTLTISGGAQVTSKTTTYGVSGHSGTTIDVAGDVTIRGAGSAIVSVAQPPLSGDLFADPGPIRVTAARLRVLDGGRITASSDLIDRAGGNVRVNARQVLLDGGGAAGFTGIESEARSAGDGGDVSVTTRTLRIAGGAGISARTLVSGSAGRIDVTARDVTIDGAGSGIFADTAATPTTDAPLPVDQVSTVIVSDAPRAAFVLIDPAGVRHALNGFDPGYDLHVADRAGTWTAELHNSTGHALTDTDVVFTLLLSPTPMGVLGNFVHADFATIPAGGTITSSIKVPGQRARGGEIAIVADHAVTLLNGATIGASTTGGGHGGDVTIQGAATVRIDRGSAVTAASSGAGAAGSVSIDAGTLTLDGASRLESTAGSTGAAGDVAVSARHGMTLDGNAVIATSAALGDGGTVTLSSLGGDVKIRTARVTAQAAGNGGNVLIGGHAIISIVDSDIEAQAGTDGGIISIDPLYVILNRSVLNASAVNGNGGNITVATTLGFLQSESRVLFTSTFGSVGSFTLNSPDIDLSGSLVTLPAAVLGRSATLSEVCPQMSGAGGGDRASSSFLIVGLGGMPAQPGGWATSYDLRPGR